MILSDTVKAMPQRGGIQISSSSGASGLVSEVNNVLSNRDLPSISGEQQRVTAVACNGLEFS